jgi:uncharacterized protein (TIGR00661 family)
MQKELPKSILIAPLDWGLGHSTRCIPLLRTLKNAGYNVIVANCGNQKKLLQQEFDNLQFIHLRGYNISYSKNKWLFPFIIMAQIPKILRCISWEKKWLDKIIEKENIHLIISDNRYGLYSKKVPCVFITHQLTIKAPFNWLEKILQKINYHFINHFSQCWIPDVEGKNNIAGILSHPKKLPTTATHYIGVLSRFNETVDNVKRYDVCVLLSGPEPQRTALEKILLKQLSSIKNKKILLIRGLPQATENLQIEGIQIENHLQGNALQKSIVGSNIIIARSGYTTVMELLSMQKKSILIPTPGQTEQEYLAKYLHQQKICLSYSQYKIDVKKAIDVAQNFEFHLPNHFLYKEDKILELVGALLKAKWNADEKDLG